jgi:hypothetical protein
MTYRLDGLFQMLFSLRSVSAACIYASIYEFGVLLTYWMASLFQMLLSLGGISAACIHASIYVFGVLLTYRLASLFQMWLSLGSYRHTQHLKAFSANTLYLSKTLSVTARQAMFSLGRISAACIYASINVFGRLFTYRLASLFQMVLSLSSISAACIYR